MADDYLHNQFDDVYGGILGQPNSPLDEMDVDELIAALIGGARPLLHAREEDKSLRALKKHLRTHPHDAAELERREGRLRTIVLQAAEHGFQEALKKALPVLRRMYETHPLRTDRVFDFHDDRVSLQL